MAGRIARLLTIALVAAAMAGCGTSKPARFYTLNSTATADGATAMRGTVAVGPVSIPAAVDQPAFVVQVEPNRVEVDEFNRWAAPLGDIIARAVAGDLVVLLGAADVTVVPLENFDPAYKVAISVQRFESVNGDAATLDAVWTVRRAATGESWSGRTVAREAASGTGFDALAAAHSRALAKLSQDIAAAIRTEARKKL